MNMFKYFSSTFPTLSSKSEAWRKAMGVIFGDKIKPKVRILEDNGLYYVDVRQDNGTYIIEEYDIPTFSLAKTLAEEYR